MAHQCPNCGLKCHCQGDIDDLILGENYNCSCCDRDDDDDYDEDDDEGMEDGFYFQRG